MPRPPFALLAAAGLSLSPALAAEPAETDAGKRAPRTELKNLAVGDDRLTVDLFAAEPMLLSPSNIDVDAQGRVWVCEIVNYRHFRNTTNEPREEGDRILVLEDTDADGTLDKRTVFYQSPEINSPHGVCVLGETVIVSAGENVLTFTDADGDLVADEGSRKVLFTGIGGVQHDHGIHSFLFGPDGKLYFNFGNEGKQLLRADGSPVVDLAGNVVASHRQPYQQGMIFRCDLNGSNVETLAWNFRNNWELAVDSFGRIWQSDNDDDGNRATRLNFVIPFGNYGYVDELTGAGWRERRVGMEAEIPLQHWHLNDPGVIPNLYQSGAGSPTGIAVYEGRLSPKAKGAMLPEEYRGNLLHCDAGPNAVRAYFLTPDGAGFAAEQKDLLTGENDRWFRPSDVAIAPDGSLIVADWYDPGVGGHLMQDISRGRLFRLRPKDSPRAYAAPGLDLTTPEGALEALNSPNLDARFQGFTALVGMGEAAIPAVRAQFASTPQADDSSSRPPAHLRARAMWALAELADPLSVADAALATDDDRLRAAGLRLLCERTDPDTAAGAAARLERIAEGLDGDRFESPALLREAAVALRGVPADATAGGRSAADLWAALAWRYVPGDRWMLEALGLAADGKWDACLEAYLAPSHGRLGPNGRPKLGKRYHEDPQAREIVWRSRAARTPELLADLIRDGRHVPAEEVPRLLRAYDFQPDSDAKRAAIRDLAFAVRLPKARAALVNLEMLSRMKGSADPADAAGAEAAVNRVLRAAAGTERFVDLVKQFGREDRDAELLELALAQPDASAGVAAARLLLERKKWDDFGPIAWGADRDRAEAALAVLGRTGMGEAVGFLTAVMDDADLDAARRRSAVAALGRMWGGVELLLTRAEAGEIPDELRQSVAVALHATGLDGFRSRIDAVFPPPPGRDDPLPSLAELTDRRGEVANGKLVFMTTGTCAKCHVVKGIGREVGPDLTEIGDKLGRQALYSSILYPSAGISHNYETHSVLTGDGQFVSGLLVSETDVELRLKDQEGIERTFEKASLLEHVKQDVSLMPADIQKLMSERELVDLVEFLTTLKKGDG